VVCIASTGTGRCPVKTMLCTRYPTAEALALTLVARSSVRRSRRRLSPAARYSAATSVASADRARSRE
jgi:hypothetical protein